MHKPKLRTLMAGLTIASALAVPLGGVASASGDAPHTTAGVKATGATGPRSTDAKGGKAKDSVRPAPTVDSVRAVCTAQITRRLTDLDRLQARVTEKASVLTPAHSVAIGTIITDAKTGLTALQAEIDAATTIDALKPLCDRIYSDFRIYALRIPQINIVLSADAIGAKQATFAELRAKLDAAITAGATPDNQADLAALLAEFDAHVAKMTDLASGVADPVLALTPADYNADHRVLTPFIATMKQARSEAKGASKAARKILHILAGDDTDGGHGEHGDVPAPAPTATT
jgi:hypothetical protein